MNEKKMAKYSVSKSDQETLNALTMVENIGKKVASNSKRTSPLTSATNDSSPFEGTFDRRDKVWDKLKYDIEFHNVSDDIETLYLMDALFTEEKTALENEAKVFMNQVESDFADILSMSVIKKRLENINLVLKHLTQISSQSTKIKEALQVAPGKNTLKVSPSYQKGTVQFFDTVDAIIKKILEDADGIEFSDTNFPKVIPVNETTLLSKIESIITGLARRVDILTDFRESLAKEELRMVEDNLEP